MGRRSGFGGLINAVARDIARAQRASAAAERRAIRDHERQQREYARAVRQHERAQAARSREAEREAKRQYLEDQLESAEDQTAALATTIEELDGILRQTLAVDDRIDFNSLRLTADFPPFAPPSELMLAPVEPLREWFTESVQRPGALARFLPGAAQRHEQKLQAAEAEYQTALADYQSRETERLNRLQEARKAYDERRFAAEWKATQRNAEVAEFEENYRAGEMQSVLSYNTMVLERSDYPPDFPQTFRLAYQPMSRELVVDYQLPGVAIVPTIAEVRYLKARDVFESKPRKPSEIRERYRDVVACVALRTIHEVLEADQGNHIEVVTFSGFVETIDRATGQTIKPYLISVRTTRPDFAKIDLGRVDPTACVRNLGASVSARADELAPVKPIIEFDMVDKRFIDQEDILGQLDARPNIMDLTPSEFEHLVGNVFAKMGLETKMTRASRDGGVDVVAFDVRPVLGGRVVIQAKRYKNTVGVAAVRDLYGTMINEGANKGILVTTSGYGADAFTFASDKPIELIDGGGLLYLCDQVGVRARIVMPSEG